MNIKPTAPFYCQIDCAVDSSGNRLVKLTDPKAEILFAKRYQQRVASELLKFTNPGEFFTETPPSRDSEAPESLPSGESLVTMRPAAPSGPPVRPGNPKKTPKGKKGGKGEEEEK